MTTTQESSGVGVRPPRPEKRLCAETVEGRSQALHPRDLGAQDSPRKPRAMHTGLEPSELGEQDSSGLPRAMHTGQEPPGSTPRPHEKTSLGAETPSEAMHAVVASTDAPIRHPPAIARGLQWDVGDTGKATSPPVNQRPSGRRVTRRTTAATTAPRLGPRPQKPARTPSRAPPPRAEPLPKFPKNISI